MTILLALSVIFFLTSIISVITGSTSLITVPALFQAGVEPRVAVATNMLALIFLSAGGTVPFLKSKAIDRQRLPLLLALTVFGSFVGALLVLVLPSTAVPFVVSVAMIAVAIFSVVKRDAGTKGSRQVSARSEFVGYLATFLLGIYGGFFSGGYVTLLTAVYVAFFGMTFIEAIATTKVINIVSSLVATALFTARGVVNYPLGIILGVVMFLGALVGSHVAVRINNTWIRRIFLVTVIILALKTLLIDVAGTLFH